MDDISVACPVPNCSSLSTEHMLWKHVKENHSMPVYIGNSVEFPATVEFIQRERCLVYSGRNFIVEKTVIRDDSKDLFEVNLLVQVIGGVEGAFEWLYQVELLNTEKKCVKEFPMTRITQFLGEEICAVRFVCSTVTSTDLYVDGCKLNCFKITLKDTAVKPTYALEFRNVSMFGNGPENGCLRCESQLYKCLNHTVCSNRKCVFYVERDCCKILTGNFKVCEYISKGCSYISYNKNTKTHFATCPYGKVSCFIPDCFEKCTISTLFDHLAKTHNDKISRSGKTMTISPKNDTLVWWSINFNKNYLAKVDVKLQTDFLLVSMQFLGPCLFYFKCNKYVLTVSGGDGPNFRAVGRCAHYSVAKECVSWVKYPAQALKQNSELVFTLEFLDE